MDNLLDVHLAQVPDWFKDRHPNLAGYQVLGISPDKQGKLAKFAEDEKLTFKLLGDPDKTVISAWAAYGEKKNYGKTYLGVIRSTFIVDPEGKIAHAWYNVRATGHVAKLFKDLGLTHS